MAKACVLRGATLMVCALLLLSSSFIAAEPAGRQWDHGGGRQWGTVAPTMLTRGRFVRKVLREEMVQADDDGVVDIGGSKRKSPGGPDPQHH
ncbi:hypothetical protein CFC21_013755 [Triticum aestivum]|uniref:Uncharacterized protein n=3 Tax=Triticinae TaxID=1648030 RepID=A0A9R1DSY2_WHEAT|nr:hypothetical protein CFC21_013755 [Triticum aestivum]